MNNTFMDYLSETRKPRDDQESITVSSGVDYDGKYDVDIVISYEWDEDQLFNLDGVIDLRSSHLNTNKLKAIYATDLPDTDDRDLLSGKIIIDTEYVQLLLDKRGKLTIYKFKEDELHELIVSQM